MNMANKITMSRIFLSVMILILLLFPWHQAGIDMPSYVVNGQITVELKYIIAGVLFIVASITDFIDGHVARKYNMVTDFGKMIDAISDKILTNTLIVVLACENMVHPVIAVIIIGRDIKKKKEDTKCPRNPSRWMPTVTASSVYATKSHMPQATLAVT